MTGYDTVTTESGGRKAMSSREEFLRKELNDRMEWFEGESKRHKRIYRGLRYIVFGLTGLSTVLAGAALSFKAQQEWFNLAVVLATAVAGAVTSIEGIRKALELWVHERNILYELKDLERDMDYEASESGALKDVDGYFQRLQHVLTRSTEDWSNKVKDSGKSR
jgi:hypothetical protein